MTASVLTHQQERFLRIDPDPLAEHAFGLLDKDPGVERQGELPVHQWDLTSSPVLQHGDGGHVRQGLGRQDVIGGEADRIDTEEVRARR